VPAAKRELTRVELKLPELMTATNENQNGGRGAQALLTRMSSQLTGQSMKLGNDQPRRSCAPADILSRVRHH